MKIRNILLGALLCFTISTISAQDGFNFVDLINWSNGNKEHVEDVHFEEALDDEINDNAFDGNAYYKLTAKWPGEHKSLDIVNDGKNNKPILTKFNSYSGQLWKLTNVDNSNKYTLTTAWQGMSKKLDCIEGPNQNRPVLNESNNLSTIWTIVPIDNEYYRITNGMFTDQSLDIVNDSEENKIQIAETGEYHGQFWKITKVKL
ncbi:RICIN domain-containing protein [Lacinutrix jangbogonensis]|uniref:RICIN domain-containing protein n=1 Tax=Lacinutrix jangbogonensis TaxID=1469557 RepID=UPI00053E81F9|nr:hypothetical protein [Lacinutrix jangbogonensis]